MLTPKFSVTQSKDSLIVTVYAPLTVTEETEYYHHEYDFKFSSRPYFLRLFLPRRVIDSAGPTLSSDINIGVTPKSRMTYDSKTRSYVIQVPKLNVAEYFPDLDMISQLLRPPKDRLFIRVCDDSEGQGSISPDIQQLRQDVTDANLDIHLTTRSSEIDESPSSPNCCDWSYGFGMQFSRIFPDSQTAKCLDILDFFPIEDVSPTVRLSNALKVEADKFDAEQYLALIMSEEDAHEVQSVINAPSPFHSLNGKEREWHLSDDSTRTLLLKLKMPPEVKRPLRLSSTQFISLKLILAEIVFAYCYDVRTTQCHDYSSSLVWPDPSTELAWNVNKLSRSVAACIQPTTVREAVIGCVRRMHCFSCWPNFELAIRVWHDVVSVLRIGKLAVLQILLDCINRVVEYSNNKYVLNYMYLEPYAVWIQSVDTALLHSLADDVELVVKQIAKVDVGLDLDELEEAARLVQNEQFDRINQQLINMDINSGGSADSDDVASDDGDSEVDKD